MNPTLPTSPKPTTTRAIAAPTTALLASPNTTYQLPPGTIAMPAGVTFAGGNSVLQGAPLDSQGRPTTRLLISTKVDYDKLIAVTGKLQAIRNIFFDVHYTGTKANASLAALALRGTDTTVQDCFGTGNWFVVLNNSLRVLIERCGWDSVVEYMVMTQAGGTGVKDTTIRKCVHTGKSVKGHVVRWDIGDNVLFEDNDFANPIAATGWNGHVYKLDNGSNAIIRRGFVGGSCQFGPNPSNTSVMQLNGLTVENAAFRERVYWIYGVQNINWSGGTIDAKTTGACVSVQVRAGRPVPTGIIQNVKATYRSASGNTGAFFFNNWSGNVKKGPGLWFNGKKIT